MNPFLMFGIFIECFNLDSFSIYHDKKQQKQQQREKIHPLKGLRYVAIRFIQQTGMMFRKRMIITFL